MTPEQKKDKWSRAAERSKKKRAAARKAADKAEAARKAKNTRAATRDLQSQYRGVSNASKRRAARKKARAKVEARQQMTTGNNAVKQQAGGKGRQERAGRGPTKAASTTYRNAGQSRTERVIGGHSEPTRARPARTALPSPSSSSSKFAKAAKGIGKGVMRTLANPLLAIPMIGAGIVSGVRAIEGGTARGRAGAQAPRMKQRASRGSSVVPVNKIAGASEGMSAAMPTSTPVKAAKAPTSKRTSTPAPKAASTTSPTAKVASTTPSVPRQATPAPVVDKSTSAAKKPAKKKKWTSDDQYAHYQDLMNYKDGGKVERYAGGGFVGDMFGRMSNNIMSSMQAQYNQSKKKAMNAPKAASPNQTPTYKRVKKDGYRGRELISPEYMESIGLGKGRIR